MSNYTKDGTVDIKKKPANKNKTGNWRACRFIFGNQCLERLAYYGMSTNLVNFFEKSLNYSNVMAANSVTNWSGTCYITPLIGAFLADVLFGRFWTITIFSCIYVVGMILLTISTFLSSQRAFHFVALYMVALGSGASKPCISSFGADQFDETDENERVQKSSFFTWLYFCINLGVLVATTILVWIQMNVGWGWGFGIPTIFITTAVGLFFSGSRIYRFQEVKGSPFTRIAQVIVASCRKFKVQVPRDNTLLFETSDYDEQDDNNNFQTKSKLDHTGHLRFFDKAAVELTSQESNDRTRNGLVNPWRLCSVTQVEELKSVVSLLPVWASGIVLNAVFSQMSAMFILQGNRMDPRMGPHFAIPSASLTLFNALGVIVGTPLYEKVIVPCVRKLSGHEQGFTQLQRMGICLFLSIFAMACAGVLEVARLAVVSSNNYYDIEHVPLSIFWQAPQYLLTGFAEVFAMVGQLEFFYDQAPDTMRSTCSALSLTAIALGNYLSSFLVTVVTRVTTVNGKAGWIPENVNRGRLDSFFWLLTVLSLINFLVYLWIAKNYIYKVTSQHVG